MPSGIDIAIRVQILEQQLKFAKGLESRQTPAKAIGAFPALEQGEIVPARILENIGPGRYIVLIKDTPVIAESSLSFASGAEITARVERTAPDIRLALVNALPEGRAEASSRSAVINEYLKWQRANPDGIRNLLASLAEKFESLKPGDLRDAPAAQNSGDGKPASGGPISETAQNSRAGRNPEPARNPGSAQSPQGLRASETAQTSQSARTPQGAGSLQDAVNVRIVDNARLVQGRQNSQPASNAPAIQNSPGAQVIQNVQSVQNTPYAAKAVNTPDAQDTLKAVQSVRDLLIAKLPAESAARLLALVERLHYSGSRDDNWIRNYARDLGLTLESDILKAMEGGRDAVRDLQERPDLKRALAEIAQLVQAEEGVSPGSAERAALKTLAALADSGIKNIEALQVANVAMQDSEGPGAFQTPIVFPENRGTAHLIIEGDGREDPAKKGTSQKIMLLLELDRLGAMRVEASLAEGRIGCLFRCESSGARELVTGALDALRESLEAAGCSVSSLGCITDENIRRENQVCLNERLGGGESLSLFA